MGEAGALELSALAREVILDTLKELLTNSNAKEEGR